MRASSILAARRRCLGAFVFGLAIAAGAAAQTGLPGLLRDIAVSPMPMTSGVLYAPVTFVPRGGEIYFASWDLTDGLELRASDGTPAGTRTVRDVCPGSCSGFWGYELVESEGILYFPGDDGVHGTELWRSDGTRAGTQMVAETLPGPFGLAPHFLTPAPGGVYFVAFDEAHGRELWWSDGTAAGTHLVIDLQPGAAVDDGPSHLAYLPSVGLVFAAEDGVHGRELWLTQGTAATTTLLADIRPGGADALVPYVAYPGAVREPRVAGGKVFFTADDGVHGSEPWASDGTAAGTAMADDVVPGALSSDPYAYFAFGSSVLFSAYDPNAGTSTLWRSDGTPAGTFALGDAAHGSAALNPFNYAHLGDTVYFTGYQAATGRELWATDGTLEGTHLAVDVRPGPEGGVVAFYGFGAAAGRLWFHGDDGVHGAEWWQSDGTSGGTFEVTDLVPGSAWSVDPWTTPRPAAIGSHVLLTAFDAARGPAVRAAEPDTTGTVVLQAAGDRAGSVAFCTLRNCPFGMTPTPGGVAFAAVDVTHGLEPWRSDGSDVGTQLVGDIAPGLSGSLWAYSTFHNVAALGDDLLLLASDCTTFNCSAADVQLWRADAAGVLTRLTEETWNLGPGDLFSWQGAGYFAAASPSANGLWRSDGTPAGTASLGGTNRAWWFSPGISTLYFNDGLLWKTDGTAGGTVPIAPGLSVNGFGRLSITSDGNGHDRLYFPGSDEETGLELWVSDGTDGGTHRVIDLLPGEEDGILRFPRPGRWEDEHLVATLGPLGVFAGNDGTHGDEPWVTDGTAGNATLLEIRAGAAGSEPRDLVTVGNRVYFVADDGVHGREPWVSDGTVAGTHLVADVRLGAESSLPLELTDWMGRLVFAADDDVHGMELWRAEPGGNGAQLVVDLRPGVAPSSPQGLTAAGERLYFFADDGITGLEPWVWSAAAALFADGFETGSVARWSRVSPF